MTNTSKDLQAVLSAYHANGAVSTDLWYDWFCTDKQLVKRGKRLAQLLSFVVNHLKADSGWMKDKYVFFKNNCPLNGKLYDSLSICSKNGGDVLYYVEDQINESRGKGVKVYSRDFENFVNPIAVFDL
jgi:hypothetical protein